MKPLARTDRLIKQVVDQDTLVYDAADASACCLNALASVVWKYCDGQHTVSEIAALVSSETTLPYGVDAEDAVMEVLDELTAHGLLVEGDAFNKWMKSMQRRDVVKMLAALPLFPAIQSITAPRFDSTTSPGPTSTPTASKTAVATTPTTTVTRSVSQSNTPSESASPPPTPLPSPTPTPTNK